MKFAILSLIALTTLLATVFTNSQTPDPFAESHDPNELPRMVRVHAEFIEIPHATYTALMAKPQTSPNDTDLRQKCAQLIAAGDARMIESLAVTALPGQSAATKGIAKFTYPSEPDYGGLGSPDISDIPLRKFVPGSPPTPSAFDTRNTGSTFEVEAQIDASDLIVELRFTPTIVYNAGKSVYNTWTNGEVSIEDSMPRFYTLSVETGATLITGQTHMVAALSPKDESGYMDSSRKIMLFVRADIITAGK